MLSYLNQYAKSINDNVAYFYFSTLFNGTFFTSLQNLIYNSALPIFPLKQNKYDMTTPIKIYEFNTYKKEKNANIQNVLLAKESSSRVHRYDYNTGKLVEKTILYSEEVANKKLLGGLYSPFDSKIMDQPIFTYYASSDNNKNETIIEEGLNNQGAEYLTLSLMGDTAKFAWALCNIEFINEYLTNSDINIIKNGHYMITKIDHIFGPNGYDQDLTLLKNGRTIKTTDRQITAKAYNE
jgi:hypothetical protein